MLLRRVLLLLIVVGATTGKQQYGHLTYDDIKDLFFNLDEGEACLSSVQCNPGMCCQRETFLVGSRACTKYSEEGEPCQLPHPYDLYYSCPCEAGLTCVVTDPDPVASVLNTEIGVCTARGNPAITGR